MYEGSHEGEQLKVPPRQSDFEASESLARGHALMHHESIQQVAVNTVHTAPGPRSMPTCE